MVKNDLRNSSLKIHLCLEKQYLQARMVKNVVGEGCKQFTYPWQGTC